MRNTATCTSFVLVLLLSTACGGSSSDAEIASLMPKDCVAVARIASIDQLVKNAREVATGAGQNPASITAEALLRELEGIGGKTALIDRTRPIAIAVSMPRATPPSPVVLVPTTDATAYAASLPAMGAPPVVSGGYVALPLGTKYEKAASPPALINKLPAGLVAVRADAEQLVAAFGPVIGGGLTAVKAHMASAFADSGSALDGEAVAEAYVSVIKSVLESAKTLELTADYRNGELDVFATLAVKPGSSLDGWASDPVDLKSLEGRLSGKGSLELLVVADWVKLWPRMGTIMEAALDMYPQQVRELLRPLFGSYEQIYKALGPIVAIDGDIVGPEGMKLMLHAAPADAGALQRQFETLLGGEAFTKLGLSIGPAKAAEAGGASIRDYAMQLDVDKFAASFGSLPQAERDSMTAVLRTFFGSGQLPVRFAAKGGRCVIAIGAQKDHAAALSSLDGTAGTWSKTAQSALSRVADCNPVLIERFDMGAMMSVFASALGGANRQSPPVPAGMRADFVVSAGARGSEWRAGFTMDIAGFAKIMKAMMPR